MSQSLQVTCSQCRQTAQKVEAVIEERAYGEMFVAVLIGRVFHHLHRDGGKMECREKIPGDWIFTLCTIDEAEKCRRVMADLLAKAGGNTEILKFLM